MTNQLAVDALTRWSSTEEERVDRARQILRALVAACAERVDQVDPESAVALCEAQIRYGRQLGDLAYATSSELGRIIDEYPQMMATFRGI